MILKNMFAYHSLFTNLEKIGYKHQRY